MQENKVPEAQQAKIQNLQKWFEITCRCVVAAFFIMGVVAVLHPEARSFVRQSLRPGDSREVLATINTQFLGESLPVKVVKIKTPDRLAIEIYESTEELSGRLIQRIDLPDKHDGYFTFNGEATNLAIDDIDGDNLAEIIAPSFDDNLVAHLNIYRLQIDSNQFELMRE